VNVIKSEKEAEIDIGSKYDLPDLKYGECYINSN